MNIWIKTRILAVAVIGLTGGATLPAFAASTFESIMLGAASDLTIFNMGAPQFSASNSRTYFQGDADLPSGASTDVIPGIAYGAVLDDKIQTSSGSNVHANLSTQRIPEPETYAMMLAGFGLMGFVVRRRNHESEYA